MLAPSAVTSRRPSGQADLILSRTERTCLQHPSLEFRSPAVSPSNSVCSAPMDALGSWGSTDSRSAIPAPSSTEGSRDVSRTSSPCSGGGDQSDHSSPHGSPDTSRRYWHRKLLKMKDDIDRAGTGFRKARSGLRSSFDGIMRRLSPTARRKEIHYGEGITLEIVKDSSRRRPRTRSIADLDENDGYDLPDHNFSTSLLLTNLQDGLFRAEIPMAKIPSDRVTIRIRDYKLEITAVKSHDGNRSKDCDSTSQRDSKPSYCGSISIPIFVNPSTLQFRLDATGNVLHIEGVMKGCGDRKQFSCSESNIRLPPVSCLETLSKLEITKAASKSSNDVTYDFVGSPLLLQKSI